MKFFRSISGPLRFVLFFIGVILAFFLTALTVWADVEATMYGFPHLGNDPMAGLACPPMMNISDTAQFSVSLRNTAKKPARPVLDILISNAGVWRRINTPVDLNPGEKKTLSWDLSAADVVLSNYIFIKASTYAAYPLKDSEGTCGIFVSDIPGLNGTVVYWLWFAASLGLLANVLWIYRSFRNTYTEKPGLPQASMALTINGGRRADLWLHGHVAVGNRHAGADAVDCVCVVVRCACPLIQGR
jgi:hypothetical protein